VLWRGAHNTTRVSLRQLQEYAKKCLSLDTVMRIEYVILNLAGVVHSSTD
jgi:hypothetical protein